MRFFVGLNDLLFGEKVVVTFGTPQGRIQKRVTVRWLEKMQAEGMFEAVPLDSDAYVLVHVLDAARGYSTVVWRIGEDIPTELCRRLRDEQSQEIFVVRTVDAAGTRSFGMKRDAWTALRERPWSAAVPQVTFGTASGATDPPLPWALRSLFAVVDAIVSRITPARAPQGQSAGSTPRFNDDRGPFWSRILMAGALIGLILTFRNGWSELSVMGVLRALLMALNFAGFAALIVALVPIVLRLHEGARVHGWRVLERTWRTAALYRKSTNAAGFAGLWWVGLGSVSLLGALAFFVGLEYVLGLVCFVLVTGMGILVAFVSPPGVLFLGASSPRALDLLAALRQRLKCRVAALLDTSASISQPIAEYMSPDNFRANEHSEWRGLVAALTDICQITVLDTSAPTEHVLFEASETFRRGALGDVVFVADAGGRFPVLERLYDTDAMTADHRIYATAPSELVTTVRSLLWHKVYKDAYPRVVQPTAIGTFVLTPGRNTPQSGYLDVAAIRANTGMICEFDYCDRDRSQAHEEAAAP